MPRIPQDIAGPVSTPRASAGSFGGGAAAAAWGRAATDLAQVASAIYEADMAQRQRNAQIGVQTELSDLEASLANDPNYEEHAEVFARESKRIIAERRKGLRGRWADEFDSSVDLLSKRSEIATTQNARNRQIDHTKAGIDEGLRQLDVLIGRETNQGLKDKLRLTAYDMIADNTHTVLSEVEAVDLKQKFDAGLVMADLRRDRAENAAATMKRLQAGEYELEAGDRQKEIDTTVRIIEAELREQDAEERRREADRIREEKEAEDTAEDELIELWVNGTLNFAEVERRRDALGADNSEKWAMRTRFGGGMPPTTSSNADSYLDLSEAASRGENVLGAARDEYAEGHLSQADYRSIREAYADAVFGRPRTYITQSLRPAAGMSDPGMQMRYADAMRAYDDWVLKNSEASTSEAFDLAEKLVGNAALVNFRDRTIGLHAPDWSGGRPRSMDDLRLAMEEVTESYADDPDGLAEQTKLIGRWMDALLLRDKAQSSFEEGGD